MKKRILLLLVFFFAISQTIVSDALSTSLVKYDASKGEYRRLDEDRDYIIGKIVNIAYELQHRAGGANAQDALYSKGRQGLKTTGGQIWTFIDNIKGQQLQWEKDFLGKYAKVVGWIFHDAQYIEVDSFSIEGKEFVWHAVSGIFKPQKKETKKSQPKEL